VLLGRPQQCLPAGWGYVPKAPGVGTDVVTEFGSGGHKSKSQVLLNCSFVECFKD
jgi:hypothetical protein